MHERITGLIVQAGYANADVKYYTAYNRRTESNEAARMAPGKKGKPGKRHSMFFWWDSRHRQQYIICLNGTRKKLSNEDPRFRLWPVVEKLNFPIDLGSEK
ncbi:MAG: hypothetical protein J7K65_05825 [Planctomycetes bacterium]|nr:hypothetical protein [Planctomycetota bacterium]